MNVNKKNILFLFLLTALNLVQAPTFAQNENEPETKKATTQEGKIQAEASNESAEKNDAKQATQSTFTPTEEVSEDLSVPFPVDI